VKVAATRNGVLCVDLNASNLDTALAELCELRGLLRLDVRQTGLTDNQVQQRDNGVGPLTSHFFDASGNLNPM
jgi:hypothetical protein